MKKIDIITLGCAKNVVDSEHIASAVARGYEVIFDDEGFDRRGFAYDAVVINTCGFILDAKQESIDTILAATVARKKGKIKQLFVMGCLAERYADELRAEIEEVDTFFGVNDFAKIIESLDGQQDIVGRILTTPSHYAYLKIAEGCNWGCGYCAIPLIRGRFKSVPMEDLIAEAEWLVARGVKELIVIAQDSTYYGLDLYNRRALAELLEKLCRIEGVEWIRLQYAYPASFPRDVLEVMAREDKICKYIDIPFQHVADNVLSTMRRGLNKQETIDLVAELRRTVPSITIRTTILVGYPTETEADMQELEDFVRQARFDRLGVFAYSEEEGTYSAENFEDKLSDEEKQSRVDRIMTIQQRISEENAALKVGKEFKVLFDRVEGEFLIGRTEGDSAEVDGEVLVALSGLDQTIDPQSFVGTFHNAKITSADVHDLYVELLP